MRTDVARKPTPISRATIASVSADPRPEEPPVHASRARGRFVTTASFPRRFLPDEFAKRLRAQRRVLVLRLALG